MKIQCEACSVEAATVYCSADEAALCGSCDRRVHRANRLAGKHHRFSLLQPSSSAQSPPLCDVCKEKRGLLFCQEDRAILCRDCDVPIHTATALTMKHSRFLLTGVPLSTAPIPSSPEGEAEAVDRSNRSSSTTTTAAATTMTNSNGSSISEYLIKMLPGWHVEDFLTEDATAHAFCKAAEEVVVEPFYGMDTNHSVLNGFGDALLPQAPCWEEVEMKAANGHLRKMSSKRASTQVSWSQ